MDSSDDNSFVPFNNFQDLDICTTECLDQMKTEYDKKKNYLNSKLKSPLEYIMECHNTLDKYSKETNIHDDQTKVSYSKADLQSKLQVVNELKIMSEVLETALREESGRVSQKEIEDLMREVLTLENEKKQRLEKRVQHKDAIIKCMAYYKRFLDCHLTYVSPDTFTFFFNRVVEDGHLPQRWIKFRSDDYKYWHFIDGTLSLEEKTDVSRILKETGSIQEVLSEVRKLFDNHKKS